MIWKPMTEDEAPLLTNLSKLSGRKVGLIVARMHGVTPISYWHAIGYEEAVDSGKAEMPYCFLSWNAAVRRSLKMRDADLIATPMGMTSDLLHQSTVRIIGWKHPDWWPDTQTENDKYVLMRHLFENSSPRQ